MEVCPTSSWISPGDSLLATLSADDELTWGGVAFSGLPTLLALVLSPLMLGVINRTKAIKAGRHGPPLFQPYYELAKLLGKGAVYSTTTTWIFRAGPIVGLAVMLMATLLVPLGGASEKDAAPLGFDGDLILLAYLLGLARFFMVAAALDTGSAFCGMGASREVFFSALAEPALLMGLAATERAVGRYYLVEHTGNMLSLSEIHATLSQDPATIWSQAALILGLVAVSLVVVLLSENSRIPVDDPKTHLELTMIHEVMVLDHSGPDLAFILYAKALKLWVLAALLVGLIVPANTGSQAMNIAITVAAIFGVAILVGMIESTMARLRLPRVPQLLVAATALAGLALVLEYREVAAP
jgi:formate hydrogenlyase subunit 4